jgi:alpha-galactosidase
MLAGRAHGYTVVAASLAAWSPPSKAVPIATPRARGGWLSDYEADSWQQGWGSLRRDLSAAQAALRLGERSFAHGLGTHAVSRIVYRLGDHYARLDTWVGIQHGVSGGKVAFRIVGDGRVLADSGPMVSTDAARKLTADLRGVHELALVVDEAGQGHHYGHGNWCDPRLTAK